jgi:hypothetical protein
VTDLLTYAQLGVRHILDPGALDHLLFLLVLAAAYRPGDWRGALRVVSAFTAGHSVTLALAVHNPLLLPTELVEFLIPITIIAAGLENLAGRAGRPTRWCGHYRPLFAGVFGLVHGAGFAGYLGQLHLDSVAIPLVGFNLGIEAAQVAVLAGSAALLAGLDRLAPHRVRVAAVSAVSLVLAARMALERSPWP